MYDLANKPKEAGQRLERAFKLDNSALRVVDSYGRWLSRNDKPEAAAAVYEAFDKKLARHPLVLEGIRDAKAGKKLPPLINFAAGGRSRGALRHRRLAHAARRRKIWRWSTCSSPSISSRRTRWRCCRSATSTRRSSGRSSRSRPMSGCRRTRR